ncbi:MAG: VOC family protein [Myxococcota bacterium]
MSHPIARSAAVPALRSAPTPPSAISARPAASRPTVPHPAPGAARGLALGLMLALVAAAGCATRSAPEAPRPPSPPAPVLLFPALNVLDLERTLAFYVDLMGMRETLRLGDATTERIEVTLSYGDANGAAASLVLQRENGRTKPYVFDAFSRVAFRVPDVDALVARIRAAGHPVLVEPHFIEAMGMKIRLAFVQDPNGARVELIGVVPRDGA